MKSLPEKIQTSRLLLRTLKESDALSLQQLLAVNKNYMLPWIPWAKREPESTEEKKKQIRQWAGTFHNLDKVVYGIFNPESKMIGMMFLFNRRGPGTLEIGYILDYRQQGKGYATEATKELTRLGIHLDSIDSVLIYCSPENKPSARVPEKLGYQFQETIREEDGTELMIWKYTG